MNSFGGSLASIHGRPSTLPSYSQLLMSLLCCNRWPFNNRVSQCKIDLNYCCSECPAQYNINSCFD